MQNKSNKGNVGTGRLKLRAQLWPSLKEEDVWHRKRSDGFITIPRTMPLFMRIMDELVKNKPLSAVYFDLWCRTYDEGMVDLDKKEEMAFYAGFSGQRAVSVWSERIRALAKLGFIAIAPGAAGELGHAVIINPYHAVKRLKKSSISQRLLNSLIARAQQIKAKDMDEPEPASS